MPLINGQKMACEPCIRGHRSTKCTHANERLMVPVRKPGRPLSSCPHPSSRPCTCTAVTAAIPRKQKCGCGSADADADAIKNEPASTSQTPLSPSRTNSSNFRVQKQAKGGSSRKQSVDITGLQRMDADQLNLISPQGLTTTQHVASSSGQSTPASEGPLYSPQPVSSHSNAFYGAQQPIYTGFPYPLSAPIVQTASSAPISSVNGRTSAPSVASSAETKKSCCGGTNSHDGQEKYLSESDSKAKINGSSGTATKGCCSPNGESQGNKTNSTATAMGPPTLPYQPDGAMLQPMQQPFGTPVAMHNGMVVFYAHPGIFNYPPQFGSYMQPLQPEQWRQFMAAMGSGQMAPPGQPFGATGPAAPQAQGIQHTAAKPDEPSWTSHECNCGDSCQCVGCAAHPYNEATQNYVRSAWNSMAHDSRSGNGHAEINGNGDTTSGSTSSEPAADSVTPTRPHSNGSVSPVPPHTPSEAASGTSEEQTLSANDFFFVSYPFADSCAGETVSCPCGDDCQCIGCSIHNNPGPDGEPAEGML